MYRGATFAQHGARAWRGDLALLAGAGAAHARPAAPGVLYVWAEGGIGDELQSALYFRHVLDAFARSAGGGAAWRVVLEAHPKLVKLYTRTFAGKTPGVSNFVPPIAF